MPHYDYGMDGKFYAQDIRILKKTVYTGCFNSLDEFHTECYPTPTPTPTETPSVIPSEFEAIDSINDVLDEGYINGNETIYDAENHSNIVTNAIGISKLRIKSSGSGLQYRLLGEVDLWTGSYYI